MLSFALLVLNTTLTNEDVKNFPYFLINDTFNGVFYNTGRDDGFCYQFMVPNQGLQTVDASLDEKYVKFEFNASKRNISSTIVVSSGSCVGKTINITGVATDEDDNPLANIMVIVIVDGNSYTVTTNANVE